VKLSMRSDYGARAVIELARRFGNGPVQSAEIAACESIPEAYLEQLLTALRKAGLIRSSRGPRGGHELARTPASITLGEVVNALEGSFLSLDCLGAANGSPASTAALTREVWQEVSDSIERILGSTTIEALLERHRARTERAMYHI
jgi:Rrf2 family cysteine metabolism transcriptional repressor